MDDLPSVAAAMRRESTRNRREHRPDRQRLLSLVREVVTTIPYD
jgi:hypothetical protein